MKIAHKLPKTRENMGNTCRRTRENLLSCRRCRVLAFV
jgi:hypothetical protein